MTSAPWKSVLDGPILGFGTTSSFGLQPYSSCNISDNSRIDVADARGTATVALPSSSGLHFEKNKTLPTGPKQEIERFGIKSRSFRLRYKNELLELISSSPASISWFNSCGVPSTKLAFNATLPISIGRLMGRQLLKLICPTLGKPSWVG